jgi:hypothetical protein
LSTDFVVSEKNDNLELARLLAGSRKPARGIVLHAVFENMCSQPHSKGTASSAAQHMLCTTNNHVAVSAFSVPAYHAMS